MHNPPRQSFANGIHATLGYSLIELAVVLAVLSLIAGTMLAVATTKIGLWAAFGDE
jgi:prepilin-type N-terminal cleavage/methylation domain-containing protein